MNDQPGAPIITPRLVLRGARLSDVNDLHECFRDEEVMRYWDTLPHPSPKDTQKWVGKMIAGPGNGVTDFVIGLKPGGDASSQVDSMADVTRACDDLKVIGKVGIWQDNEIGFLLSRKYWGQGFAVEAVSMVLDIAFGLTARPGIGTDGSHHVEEPVEHAGVVADVDPRNQASLGILRKLGFEAYATKEKTFQVGDDWVDSVYLSLQKDVWLAKKQALGLSHASG